MTFTERLIDQLKAECIPTYSMSESQLKRAIEIAQEITKEMENENES